MDLALRGTPRRPLRRAALASPTLRVVAAALALTGGSALAQTPSQRLDRAAFDAETVSVVQTDAATGVPTFLAGRLSAPSSDTPGAVSARFLADNAAVFGLRSGDDVITRSVDRDDLGLTHVRVQQTIGGVPVFGGDAVVHLDRTGAVYAFSGHLRPAPDAAARPQALLSADAALAAARADVGVTEERAADELSDWTPDAHLVYLPTGDGLALAYHVRLYQDAPFPANWNVFVDAVTGAAIERWNAIHTVAPALSPFVAAAPAGEAFPFMGAMMTPATGSGTSLYSGTVTLSTDRVSSTSYRLYDTSRISAGIRTRSANLGTSLPGSDITDSDNNFTSTTNRAGIDAHWGAAKVYDYYLGTHNRNSYNNAGAALNSTVQYRQQSGVRYNNAFWNGAQMVYGDGDGTTFTALVDLDICAHELTHAVTERTAGLVYNREPGALNESVSDIFAVMVDRDDWTVGEKSYTPGTSGDALRSLSNPTAEGQPDTYANRLYQGSCTPSSTNDYCGVHTNSGIPNHAAYLMAAGGTKGGVTVGSIGRGDTERIWYRALTSYFTSSTDFAGARAGTIQAATDLFGSGSAQVASVTNAWAAVGVGSGSTGGGGGTPPATAQWYYEARTYQSPHNYPNNYNASNTYTKAGAQRVAMYFEQFSTEANYDYVYIRDASGTATASYTGNKAAFWAIVDGASITANLVSDYSVTAYGYRVTQVAYYSTSALIAGGTPMGIVPTAAPSDALLGIAGSAVAAKSAETLLLPARPNPTRGATTVAFTMGEAGPARVTVVDVLGREVAVLLDGSAEAGPQELTLGALPAGTYRVVLDASGTRQTQALTVVR